MRCWAESRWTSDLFPLGVFIVLVMETKYDTTKELLEAIGEKTSYTLPEVLAWSNEIVTNLEVALHQLRFSSDRHAVQEELQALEKSIQWINSNIAVVYSALEQLVHDLMEAAGEPRRAFTLSLGLDSFRDPHFVTYQMMNLHGKRMEFLFRSKFRNQTRVHVKWLSMPFEQVKKELR